MVANYIPKQGDICYIDFTPTKGHEQTGKRPAIVISKYAFNKYTGMVLVCPITSNTKNFVTHHLLLNTKKIRGAVLCEHIRSIDYNARNLSYVEKINKEELDEIIDIITGFIELN